MQRCVLRRALAVFLVILLAVPLFASYGISLAMATEYDSSYSVPSAGMTLNNGDTVKGLTVSGSSDPESPTVITVNGTINVEGTISVVSGYVRFVGGSGGGVLLRHVSGFGEIIRVSDGATIEIKNAVLDGNKQNGITATFAALSVRAQSNPGTYAGSYGKITLGQGSVVKNNYSTANSQNCAGVRIFGINGKVADTELVLDGGQIIDNYHDLNENSPAESGYGIMSTYGNITLKSGSVLRNGCKDKSNLGIYTRSSAANLLTVNIVPSGTLHVDVSVANNYTPFKIGVPTVAGAFTFVGDENPTTDFSAYQGVGGTLKAFDFVADGDTSSGSTDPDPDYDFTVAPVINPSVDTVTAGEEFTVDVVVNSSGDYSAVETNVGYDPEYLTYVTYEPGDGLTESQVEVTPKMGTGGVPDPGGQYLVSIFGEPQEEGELTLATLTFKANVRDDDAETEIVTADVLYGISGDTREWEGDGVTATVQIVAPEPPEPTSTISFLTNSKLAPEGYKVLVYAAEQNTYGYTYDGKQMFYAAGINAGEGKYAFITIVADTVTEESALVPVITEAAPTVATGDVNGSNKVNIVDAQIAFDLLHTDSYATLDDLSIEARLNADVNGDGQLTDADSSAIQRYLHYGSFE